MSIANSPFQSIAAACAAASSWEDAVDNVVEHLITEGECFSSGEVVTHIRTHRMDLRFAHRNVGERLQNSFSNGTFPEYDDFGVSSEPHQVSRQTSGHDIRTPAGISVFVYGPSQAEAMVHHFEVNVPLPCNAGSLDGAGTPPQGLSQAAALLGATPAPVPVKTAKTAKVVTAHGKIVPGDVIAKVHSDGRICIPKLAFESLAHETGTPVVGGQPLFATWKGLKVELHQTKGLSTVYPTVDQCRVHLTPPSPLDSGSEYDVGVAADTMTIDFSNPL